MAAAEMAAAQFGKRPGLRNECAAPLDESACPLLKRRSQFFGGPRPFLKREVFFVKRGNLIKKRRGAFVKRMRPFKKRASPF